MVARRLHLPPNIVGRLWRSYQETAEYTRRQGQGRSCVTATMQDRFLILLSRRNHMSTAKALTIDFCRATEVHFPDQIVRNKLHYNGMRARRHAQGPVLTAHTVQCDSTLLVIIRSGRFFTGYQISSDFLEVV